MDDARIGNDNMKHIHNGILFNIKNDMNILGNSSQGQLLHVFSHTF